jgi:hypothetical protein
MDELLLAKGPQLLWMKHQSPVFLKGILIGMNSLIVLIFIGCTNIVGNQNGVSDGILGVSQQCMAYYCC